MHVARLALVLLAWPACANPGSAPDSEAIADTSDPIDTSGPSDASGPSDTSNAGDTSGANDTSPTNIEPDVVEPDTTRPCADAPCTVAGAKRCDGAVVEVCGDTDGDGCLDWGTRTACDDGLVCANGFCAIGCADACTTVGAVKCDGNATTRCDDLNGDGCLEWGAAVACGANESCSNGRCELGCTNECVSTGERRCDGNGVAICGDTDADDCLEWGTVSACAPGSSCSNGVCAATCSDECGSAGQKSCDAGGNVITCGDTDTDDCLEWGSPVACGGGATCDAGACRAPSIPTIRINELVVDSAGSPDTDSFVELRGTPGTDLAGWTLVGINGNGGTAYATVTLQGAIPADGLFVVAHPQAAPALLAVADMRDAKVDFQNGPDSVQLKMGSTIVDALGYGAFDTDVVFAGEGSPAAAPRVGEALTRDAEGSDTDDNAADFVIAAPSPGVADPGGPVGDPCLGITEDGCCTADGSATFYCSGGVLKSKRCDDSACVLNGYWGHDSCEEDVPSNSLSFEMRNVCPDGVPDVCADACEDEARCRIECGVACPCGPAAGFTPRVMSSAHWNDGSKTTVVLIDKAQSPSVCMLADTFENAPATAAKAYRISFAPPLTWNCATPGISMMEYIEWDANGTPVVRDHPINVAALGSDENEGCHVLIEAAFKGGNVIDLEITVPWGAGVRCVDLP